MMGLGMVIGWQAAWVSNRRCARDCVANLTRLQADSLVSLCHKWPIESYGLVGTLGDMFIIYIYI